MDDDNDQELSQKEIAQRLDTLLAQFMSLLDKSLQLRENISQVLKNGHFNISKAKYSMGSLAVSQYKFPNNIKPSILVSVSSTNKPDSTYSLLNTQKHGSLSITNKVAQDPTSDITASTNNTNNNKENDDVDESNYNSNSNKNAPILIRNTSKDSPSSVSASSLRRRRADSGSRADSPMSSSGSFGNRSGKKKVKDDEHNEDDDDISNDAQYLTGGISSLKIGGNGIVGYGGGVSDEDDEEEVKVKNPLNWFGVLVPQPLRQAQSEFSKAVEQIVELANIVREMELHQKEYFVLLSKKNAT